MADINDEREVDATDAKVANVSLIVMVGDLAAISQNR